MSRDTHRAGLQQDTQRLLNGPLKNARMAALAAVLVPLASVAATPAQAQEVCQSAGTVCGVVWNDTNNNGVQDAGETGVEGVKVFLFDGTETIETETSPEGFYFFQLPDGTYTIFVQLPPGTQPSPANAGGDDTLDSDGVADGLGNSVATGVPVVSVPPFPANNPNTDFGLVKVQAPPPPGTGTPGYWKNHPEAWPVSTITAGGVTYTLDEAIAWLRKVGKDKTTTMFSSLVPAMLNVMVGNDDSCVASTIADANAWLAAHPLGSNVAGSSAAWAAGEPLHRHLDEYNNGRLCAPHRD